MNNMKKLLLLLFSLMFSFNSYGGSFIDFSLSDFCYQQPNVQDRGGVYYFANESEGITANSLCVYKDLYGQYMSKVNLKNGRFDGKFIRWWENGQKHQEKNYINGKLDGKWTDWWSDGRVFFEKNYKDGKKDGKQTHWDENGQIVTEAIYKDGEILDEAVAKKIELAETKTKIEQDKAKKAEVKRMAEEAKTKEAEILVEAAAKKIELAEAKRKKEEVKTKLAEIKRKAEETKTQEAEILAKEATAIVKEAEAKTKAEELKTKEAEAKTKAEEIKAKEAVKEAVLLAQEAAKDAEILAKEVDKQVKEAEAKRIDEELKLKEAEAKRIAVEIEIKKAKVKQSALEAETKEAELLVEEAFKQLEEDKQKKNLFELEIAELKSEQERIQYNRMLVQAIQDEQDITRSIIIEDQLNRMKSSYVIQIASKVKTLWRYQAAEEDWSAEVYVVQDKEGNVKAVDVRNVNVGDSSLGKSFMDSIERAVYKSSPLPAAPDEAVFDKELYFIFSVN